MSDRAIAVLLHSRAFYPRIGGLERVSQILAEELTALGHRITVLTDTPLGDAEEVGPYRVVRGASSSEMRKLVAEADLVHVNGFSVQLVRHCWWARKPLIWTHAGHQAVCTEGNVLHGQACCGGSVPRCIALSVRTRGLGWALRHGAELLLRRLLLHSARINVCVSDWVARRIRAPRSRVIWNPADVEPIPAATPREFVRSCFTFFGRLVPEKGAATLIEAVDMCRRGGLSVSARLIGDGPELERLRARASELGIGDAIAFLGFLRGHPLWLAQQQAWVVVIPTLCEEAMGLVAVEAMAHGTPLIVSRRGGLVEVTEACAIAFENGEPAELAAAMTRIVSDGALWQRLAQAGPARAARFRRDVIAGEYARLYAEVLA